jgi:hypothetical protein
MKLRGVFSIGAFVAASCAGCLSLHKGAHSPEEAPADSGTGVVIESDPKKPLAAFDFKTFPAIRKKGWVQVDAGDITMLGTDSAIAFLASAASHNPRAKKVRVKAFYGGIFGHSGSVVTTFDRKAKRLMYRFVMDEEVVTNARYRSVTDASLVHAAAKWAGTGFGTHTALLELEKAGCKRD